MKKNIFRSPVSKGKATKTRYYFVLYEAQSVVIIVYVRFLETLLKDLTNDMKFWVIMKQFWLSFALTKNKLSEIISANFFLFFNIATML